jgi:hypothetical protein
MATFETQSQFAARIKRAKSRVSQLKADGRLVMDPDTGLVNVEASLARIEAMESPLPHHQARKEQFDAPPPASPPPKAPEAMEAAEKIGLRLKFATMKERESRAGLAAIELDKTAGALLERTEVDFVIADIGVAIRSQLDGLADRHSHTLAACLGDVGKIHATLKDLATSMLHEIADHMKRKAEGLEK